MDQTRVTAWSERSGQLLCSECAEDVRTGGGALTQTRVLKGRLCAYCGQMIGREESP